MIWSSAYNRPSYLLVPLDWSGGTCRPHIGLGQQINFHPHFGGKIGTLKKYPENPLLAPNHVAGVYKRHGTLKFQSEGLTNLLQGDFCSFMRLKKSSCKRLVKPSEHNFSVRWCLYAPATCFGAKRGFSGFFLTMPIFDRK